MPNPIEAQQRGLTRESSWEEFKDSAEEFKDSALAEFELSWGKGLDAEDVLRIIGIDQSAIENALAGLDAFTQGLNSLLSVVEGLVDVLAEILGVFTEGFQGLIEVIQEVIRNIVNIFTGISISTLIHFPQTPKSRKTVDEVIYDVGMAYLDKSDSRRPVTITETYGYVLMAVWQLPNLSSLLSVFENLKSSFGKLSVDPNDRIGRYQQRAEVFRGENYLFNGSTGMNPDFAMKIDLTDFFAIEKLVKSLLKTLNKLESRKSYAQALAEIVELARKKVSSTTAQIQAVLNAVNDLAQLFAFGEAQAVLSLSGTGTSEDFARAIINSPHHESFPSYDLAFDSSNPHTDKGLPDKDSVLRGKQSAYCGVFLLHAQVANPIGGAAKVADLFNKMVKRSEDAVVKVEDAETRVTTNWKRMVDPLLTTQDYNASKFQE